MYVCIYIVSVYISILSIYFYIYFLSSKESILIHFLPFTTTKTSQKSSSNKGEKRERCVDPLRYQYSQKDCHTRAKSMREQKSLCWVDVTKMSLALSSMFCTNTYELVDIKWNLEINKIFFLLNVVIFLKKRFFYFLLCVCVIDNIFFI